MLIYDKVERRHTPSSLYLYILATQINVMLIERKKNVKFNLCYGHLVLRMYKFKI